MSRTFDYIVAGAGSAGCALAARLCEDPNLRVLLIESGGHGRSVFTRMPAGNGILIGNPKYDQGLQSEPQSGLHDGTIYYPRGSGLGGSSLLNGMVYMRGNRADYDGWKARGLDGWSYAEVLPYFRRAAAAVHRPDNPYHGTDGPIKLSPSPNEDPLSGAFLQACQQAGVPYNEDFNGKSQRGVGRFDSMVFDGLRQSSAQAYLSRIPPNLTVLTRTPVLEVVMEGIRAVGVRLDNGVVRAEREIILSLGAFHSPRILMLSGIGPARHLESVGVKVRQDLPGVGSRLLDHPNMPVQFQLREPALSWARYQRLDRALWMGVRYLLNRSGPGSGPFWSVILFFALRSPEMPELEVFFTPMAVRESSEGGGWNVQTLLHPGRSIIARGKSAEPGFQLDINLLRPKSFGTVRLASNDPGVPPRIDPGYLSHEDDLRDLVAGVSHMRDIISQPAMQHLAGDELSPGNNVRTQAEIEQAVRRLLTTGHHPVGTCPMAADNDPNAVLDNELRVRGVDSLRVVDGSSFPGQISGNVHAPIVMVAEKAADLILGRMPLAPHDPEKSHV